MKCKAANATAKVFDNNHMKIKAAVKAIKDLDEAKRDIKETEEYAKNGGLNKDQTEQVQAKLAQLKGHLETFKREIFRPALNRAADAKQGFLDEAENADIEPRLVKFAGHCYSVISKGVPTHAHLAQDLWERAMNNQVQIQSLYKETVIQALRQRLEDEVHNASMNGNDVKKVNGAKTSLTTIKEEAKRLRPKRIEIALLEGHISKAIRDMEGLWLKAIRESNVYA